MALLLSRNGIRHLKVIMRYQDAMSVNQAKTLLEGVASSPSLEIFDFHVWYCNQEVGRHLVQALRRNQSLKKVNLATYSFSGDSLANLMKPPTFETSIMDRGRALPLDVLQGALCRRECTLEKLELDGISILTGNWREG